MKTSLCPATLSQLDRNTLLCVELKKAWTSGFSSVLSLKVASFLGHLGSQRKVVPGTVAEALKGGAIEYFEHSNAIR